MMRSGKDTIVTLQWCRNACSRMYVSVKDEIGPNYTTATGHMMRLEEDSGPDFHKDPGFHSTHCHCS